MKRVRIIGPVLVLAFALSAVAASAASASLPEFVPENSNFPLALKFTSGTGVLETVGGRKVVCKRDTGSGEVTGEKTAGQSILLFDGCTASGPFGIQLPCTTEGKAEGSIETNALKGTLVYDTTAAQKAKGEKGKASVVIEPEQAGGLFAEFTCKSGIITETLKVRGSVLGLILPSAINSGFTKVIPISATLTPSGKPTDKEYENAAGEISTVKLETKGEGAEAFGYEESAILGEENLIPSKGIEVKA